MTQRASEAGRAIHLKGVGKAWGDTVALTDVNVEIPAGSFTALLGPSGCGKSTLLRIVSGLEEASTGHVLIGGQDVIDRPADKRDLAMVFQSYALFPHLSVAENIVFGLRTRHVRRAERQARLTRVADLLGLAPYLGRKPAELSGGQQQRVALGRAIISERPVCLMDEPLSNLDAKLRQTMRTELRALQRKLGFTMLYVTHDQVEAITMADQVVLINNGRVEQIATPHDLYRYPATCFAARFIGTPPMNILPMAALGDTGARIEAAAGCALMLGIRPEDLHPARDGASGGVALTLHVTGIEYLGADALVHGMLGDAPAVMRVPGHSIPAPGTALPLTLDMRDLHLFDARSGDRFDLPHLASLMARPDNPAGDTGAMAPPLRQKDT